MSAACSHVIAPLKARMMTSWIFMARSTAVAANTMGTSLAAHGCTAACLKSGHFICSRERTDHVLPTARAPSLPGAGSCHIVLRALEKEPSDLAIAPGGNPHVREAVRAREHRAMHGAAAPVSPAGPSRAASRAGATIVSAARMDRDA